jgi:hypothetical protein
MDESSTKRPLDESEAVASDVDTKRAKGENTSRDDTAVLSEPAQDPSSAYTAETATLPLTGPTPPSRTGLKPAIHPLPPSLELITGVKSDIRARKGFASQDDVGIIGYAGKVGIKGIRGVIKQR